MVRWPEHILKTTNPISLADLRTMDLAKFQKLVLTAFKRLGYLIWLSERFQPNHPLAENDNARYNILLRNDERSLLQCSQEKELVHMSLIKDFRRNLKREGTESGFFVTTGMVTLQGSSYLSSEAVDFIDAKKLIPFLKTVFGEATLKKEISQTFERRELPRFDLRKLKGNKILRRLDTLYGTTLQIEGEIADISCGGICFESVDKIPPESLLRLELSLPEATEPIRVVGRVIWQEAKAGSLGYNLGLSFFLIRDKDKQQISNFVKSRVSQEIDSTAQKTSERLDIFSARDGSAFGGESDEEFLLRQLVEKNIIGVAIPGLYSLGKRGIRRMSEVDIKKVEASVRRFFKKMFLKKCKILEIRKLPTGWEALAKKIDDWFEKRGYRDVYEKKIYVIKLDNKFKVVSYFQIGSDDAPKKSDLKIPQGIDADKIREIVREVAREVSAGSGNNVEKLAQEIAKTLRVPGTDEDTLKKVALEAADEIERRRKGQDLQKKLDEEIKIRETYISPLEKVKLERNFARLGKVEKAKRGIKNHVRSLQGMKRKRR